MGKDLLFPTTRPPPPPPPPPPPSPPCVLLLIESRRAVEDRNAHESFYRKQTPFPIFLPNQRSKVSPFAKLSL